MMPQPTVVIAKVIRFWAVRMIIRAFMVGDHLDCHDDDVFDGEGAFVDGGRVQHTAAPAAVVDTSAA